MTIEMIVHDEMPNMSAAKRKVMEDFEVDVQWLSMSVDVDLDYSQELLEAIVDLWVTIRGHALTRQLMEEYKLATKKGTKKRKGLRKNLKKESEEEPQAKRKK